MIDNSIILEIIPLTQIFYVYFYELWLIIYFKWLTTIDIFIFILLSSKTSHRSSLLVLLNV